MENEPGTSPGGASRPEAVVSPHVAPDPWRPARRGVPRVAAGAVAAVLVVAGVLAYGLAPRSTAPRSDAPERGRPLAPLQAAADPRTGEVTAPFQGFAVSVETVPPGALVTIDGVERGEAPVLAGLECSPGERVAIAARKGGFRPARAATTCREDTLVKLTVRLGR
jgi:PEGA domain-containing protein